MENEILDRVRITPVGHLPTLAKFKDHDGHTWVRVPDLDNMPGLIEITRERNEEAYAYAATFHRMADTMHARADDADRRFLLAAMRLCDGSIWGWAAEELVVEGGSMLSQSSDYFTHGVGTYVIDEACESGELKALPVGMQHSRAQKIILEGIREEKSWRDEDRGWPAAETPDDYLCASVWPAVDELLRRM